MALHNKAQDVQMLDSIPAKVETKSFFTGAIGGFILALGSLMAFLQRKSNQYTALPSLKTVTVDLGTLSDAEYDDVDDWEDTRQVRFGGFSLYDAPENGLTTLYNKKKGIGCTLNSGGSSRKRARVSGFRTRRLTTAGRNLLKRRRAKGRWVLCPASVIASKHKRSTR